jgi:hypothetical protein
MLNYAKPLPCTYKAMKNVVYCTGSTKGEIGKVSLPATAKDGHKWHCWKAQEKWRQAM